MNLNETPQRIRWVTFAVLVGLAVILSILDNSGRLDDVFGFISNPVGIIMDWTAGRTDALADALAGPRDLQAAQEEITRLEARVAELEREVEELREVQGEYQLLLALFDRARETPEFSRLTASVIGRDTNPTILSLIIDKGYDDGVRVGMPVESARGLVGQVFRTSANISQVVLVSDNASAIPARLGSSRATGVLRGGGLGNSTTIEWIDLKYQVEEGEVVLTSGLGGKFPQDLVIGRVIEVERREAELFQQAVVQPAVDFDSLEVVFVIRDFQPVDTDIFTDLSQDQ